MSESTIEMSDEIDVIVNMGDLSKTPGDFKSVRVKWRPIQINIWNTFGFPYFHSSIYIWGLCAYFTCIHNNTHNDQQFLGGTLEVLKKLSSGLVRIYYILLLLYYIAGRLQVLSPACKFHDEALFPTLRVCPQQRKFHHTRALLIIVVPLLGAGHLSLQNNRNRLVVVVA